MRGIQGGFRAGQGEMRAGGGEDRVGATMCEQNEGERKGRFECFAKACFTLYWTDHLQQR